MQVYACCRLQPTCMYNTSVLVDLHVCSKYSVCSFIEWAYMYGVVVCLFVYSLVYFTFQHVPLKYKSKPSRLSLLCYVLRSQNFDDRTINTILDFPTKIACDRYSRQQRCQHPSLLSFICEQKGTVIKTNRLSHPLTSQSYQKYRIAISRSHEYTPVDDTAPQERDGERARKH